MIFISLGALYQVCSRKQETEYLISSIHQTTIMRQRKITEMVPRGPYSQGVGYNDTFSIEIKTFLFAIFFSLRNT